MVSDEHPNAALIRRLYSAWAAGDMATVRECFAPDAVWHVPGRSLIAGDHRGWEAIARDFYGRLRELTDGSFKAELTDVLADDRVGVALQHATGTRGERRLDIGACQVMRLRDGKIVEVRSHYSDQYALDAFWS
jgi:uncharacterized protein (TIGR02246 family)